MSSFKHIPNINLFADKKGNSLFAEVDDQRQEMRDLLQRQKQQYYMVIVMITTILSVHKSTLKSVKK